MKIVFSGEPLVLGGTSNIDNGVVALHNSHLDSLRLISAFSVVISAAMMEPYQLMFL
jgi:hypothetical protein